MRRSATEEGGVRTHRSVVVLALMLSAAGTAVAQSNAGEIRGLVTDTVGNPLQGASIRLQGTATQQFSNAAGRFLFANMPAGRYRLRASRIGAEPALDSVVVERGRTTQVRFSLRLIPIETDTLPPRFARGTRPDTAPSERETLDLVSRVARLPVLRVHPPGQGRRELRLWVGGGIGIPEDLIRLTIDGERVQGQVVRYVIQTLPDREVDPRWRAFMDSVPDWLRHTFGCGEVSTDTLRHSGAQQGYRSELVAVCTSHYPREPDWRALLRELEAHQVWTLPDESELPSIANVVSVDGGGVTVEAWDGGRYHTYTYGLSESIPTPERRDAGAIHRTLIAFLTRLHDDLHPRKQ